MRTIIAGSRTGFTYKDVCDILDKVDWEITTVISGCARGVDTYGVDYAELWEIPVERYPANWELYGRSAGYLRNEEMAKVADAAVILWDGTSKGTKHMIKLAEEYNLKTYIVDKSSILPCKPEYDIFG